MDVIATRIFDLVKERGIEQKEFALMLGVTDKKVSAWKTGRSSTYTKILPQIADALSTTTEYLLNGTEPTSFGQGPTKEEMQAAFWGGEKDLTQEDLDAMWADVENFAAFVAQKRRQKKKND